MNLTILAATLPTLPATPQWNLTIGIVMSVFSVLGLLIARTAVKKPAGVSEQQFSLGQLLGGLSFGHILGTGIVLGLTNSGIL